MLLYYKNYSESPSVGRKNLKPPIQQHWFGFVSLVGIPLSWILPETYAILCLMPFVLSALCGRLPLASFISYTNYYFNKNK